MNKRTYTKPQVKRVKLNIEEAVLAGCKTGGAGDTPKTSTCTTSGTGACCKATRGS